MTEDALQLRQFVEKGDEEAFQKLVSSHFNVVYGTALRLTNSDAAMAEDIAQSVFTDLALKARLLPRDIVLAGWLHKAARFAASKAVRTEQRRRTREKEAFAMQDVNPEPSPEWERLHPVLDAALSNLNARDRDAILLHYFEEKSFRIVGLALGVSDDAAQKRVGRALEKLRTILMRGGVAVSGPALSTFLSAGMIPPSNTLALSVAKSSLAKAAAAGPPGIVTALLHKLAAAKVGVALGALGLLVAGVVIYLVSASQGDKGKFVTVNLSPYLNGALSKSWTPAYGGENSLAELREGRRRLNRVPFEIHGVVQLEGAEWKRRAYKFPESVDSIPIRASGSRIHLLHANSAIADPPGTVVANLIVHYSDGDQAKLDIRQGFEVLDWWGWPLAAQKLPADTNTTIAWSGENPAASSQGASVRLFDTAFVNPHPEKEIQSIDYVSAMAGSAPFMVGLTIER